MSNELSKTDYLKRYMEDDSKKKRKKKLFKKPSKSIIPCVKIFSETIDIKSIHFGSEAAPEDEEDEEDVPVVAAVIDERPQEEKIREIYSSQHWKRMGSPQDEKEDAPLKQNSDSDGRGSPDRSRKRHDSDSDLSPSRHNSRDDSDSDLTPPRNQKRQSARHDSDSDLSPPRSSGKNKGDNHSNLSRKKYHKSTKPGSDSDLSPPRSSKSYKEDSRHKLSPKNDYKKRKNTKPDSDSDLSPPRHSNVQKKAKHKNGRDHSDSDLSPPRYPDKGHNSKRKEARSYEGPDRGSVHSPPRSKKKKRWDSGGEEKKADSDSDLSPPRVPSHTNSRPVKTLSGLSAGLQSARTLKREAHELREKERRHIQSLSSGVSGRDAETVVRDRRTGKRRDVAAEEEKEKEKQQRERERQRKYEQWGKGLAQTDELRNKLETDLYESSKPLARHRDDDDLDEQLRAAIHEDDPMAEYIRKKRKTQQGTPSVPSYSGPAAPPNRFGLRPGYRWDGVDRSNGFEKRYFESKNKRAATEEEAYLWSIQDM